MSNSVRASVIIPTLNEARWVGTTLQKLLNQTSTAAAEVIVVDTGSSDNTCDIVAQYPVRLLHVRERSPYAARNFGIAAAQSDKLIFLDARCFPQPGWLEELLSQADDFAHHYIAGRTETKVVDKSIGSRLLACRISADMRKQSALAGHVAACNMLVHRKVFEALGQFHTNRSGSDVHFSESAAVSGFTIVYAEKAAVDLQCAISLLTYLGRRFRIRRGQEFHRAAASCRKLRFTGVPWRPGVREAIRMAPLLNVGPARALALLWAERWAGYFGSLAGQLDHKRHTLQNS